MVVQPFTCEIFLRVLGYWSNQNPLQNLRQPTCINISTCITSHLAVGVLHTYQVIILLKITAVIKTWNICKYLLVLIKFQTLLFPISITIQLLLKKENMSWGGGRSSYSRFIHHMNYMKYWICLKCPWKLNWTSLWCKLTSNVVAYGEQYMNDSHLAFAFTNMEDCLSVLKAFRDFSWPSVGQQKRLDILRP